MTYNLLNNGPCLAIDSSMWTKTTNARTIYIVDNNVILSKAFDNADEKPELLIISRDFFKKCFGDIFISPKIVQDPIVVVQNFKPINFQFKVNQLTTDFHSIKPIGKGGFGRVYSAVSKVDWQMYAIKKVIINCSKFNKKEITDTLKEFRILAKLNHGNIVRYHTAWFEKIDETNWNSQVEHANHFSESFTKSISKKSHSSSININSSVNCSSSKSINESYLSNVTGATSSNTESSYSNGYDGLNIDSSNTRDKQSEDNIVFNYSSNTNQDKNSIEFLTSKEKHQGTIELYNVNNQSSNASIPRLEFALYIQMELCQFNLQDWLIIRNKQPGCLQNSDIKNIRCIARQLLKGVEYIHSNKVIHRDIKPANIFLTVHQTHDLQLKIGDFGLSKLFEFDMGEEFSITQKMKLTANTGTAFYSAPEVFNTKHKRILYSHKCDLYSVGIILLELMVKFTTSSELCRVISNLSNGIMFNELMENWPLEAPHVMSLISICPEIRPEASFILNQTCCFKESYVQNGIYDHIKSIMSENSNLKSENEILRKKLDSLLLSLEKV